ncbi:unnamed protein product [Rodentolepis nana]|uniref:Bestrophin homolog n=1 Tax=Rodentolepis nana TaxID=102285 RepID=A0A0R3TFZ4_RODNA|nr:unnamed protein product [Rodentolepis nana]
MIIDIFTALAVFMAMWIPAALPLSILIFITRWNFGNEQFDWVERESISRQDRGVNTDFNYVEENGVDNLSRMLKLHDSIQRMLHEYTILMNTALSSRNEAAEIHLPDPVSGPPPSPRPLSWRPHYRTNNRDAESRSEVSLTNPAFDDVIKELKGRRYTLRSTLDKNETRSLEDGRKVQNEEEEERQVERESHTI